MQLLPEVCRGQRNNPLHFRDDPDYDMDPGSTLKPGSLGGGLQSLTDLLMYVNKNKTYDVVASTKMPSLENA